MSPKYPSQINPTQRHHTSSTHHRPQSLKRPSVSLILCFYILSMPGKSRRRCRLPPWGATASRGFYTLSQGIGTEAPGQKNKVQPSATPFRRDQLHLNRREIPYPLKFILGAPRLFSLPYWRLLCYQLCWVKPVMFYKWVWNASRKGKYYPLLSFFKDFLYFKDFFVLIYTHEIKNHNSNQLWEWIQYHVSKYQSN